MSMFIRGEQAVHVQPHLVHLCDVVRYLRSVPADHIQMKEYIEKQPQLPRPQTTNNSQLSSPQVKECMKNNHNFLVHKQLSSQRSNSYPVHHIHVRMLLSTATAVQLAE